MAARIIRILVISALALPAVAVSGAIAQRAPRDAPPISFSASSGSCAAIEGAQPPTWMATGGVLSQLVTAGLPNSLIQTDFNTRSTVLLVSKGQPNALAPQASLGFHFTSASALVKALNSGTVPTAVRYLLLDLERWSLTPTAEQQDPTGALQSAETAARAHGKCLIYAPAVDLTLVAYPGDQPPALYTDFERSIVSPAAGIADSFEIQAQRTEGTPYASSFAPQAIGIVHAVRPLEPVFVGLSTNPNGAQVTAADLRQVYDASMPAGAQGFWLSIPGGGTTCPLCGTPQPGVAVTFLEQLAGM